MPKLATLIVRPRYPHRNQIKTDYKTQSSTDLVLNDEIKKKLIKKRHKKQLKPTWVNPLSTILESWGQNNIIKCKKNKLCSLILNQPNIK